MTSFLREHLIEQQESFQIDACLNLVSLSRIPPLYHTLDAREIFLRELLVKAFSLEITDLFVAQNAILILVAQIKYSSESIDSGRFEVTFLGVIYGRYGMRDGLLA
jgi:hypothetical protein